MGCRRLAFFGMCAVGMLAGCGDDATSSDGNDGGDGTTAAADDSGPDAGTVSASTAPTSTDSVTSTSPTASDSSATTDVADTTAGPAGTCADWAPPPGDCAPPDGAMVQVDGDLLDEMLDTSCQVTNLESLGPDTDGVQLDCSNGNTYELQITTSPHLDLPLGGVADVVVTAGPAPAPPAFGQPSFSISTTGGQLLVLYVNELDHAADVATEPIALSVTPSGCPGVDMAVICDAGGSLLVQRQAVEFGNGVVPIVLFDGNQGIVPGNADDYSVIVDEAAAITCWDDDCAADDSGPSDRLVLFAVLLPSA